MLLESPEVTQENHKGWGQIRRSLPTLGQPRQLGSIMVKLGQIGLVKVFVARI